MIREALDRLIELGRQSCAPEVVEIHGLPHVRQASGTVYGVGHPQPTTLVVHSLEALASYVEGQWDEDCGDTENSPATPLVAVESVKHVGVYTALRKDTRSREHLLRAVVPEVDRFIDGAFIPVEEFVVQVMARFQPSTERDAVIAFVSRLEAENNVGVTDDGLSQTATARRGVVQRENVEVKNPVILTPYRTFSEVAQPSSPYILRLDDSFGPNEIRAGLFEADGGGWQVEALENIRGWLKGRMSGATVI